MKRIVVLLFVMLCAGKLPAQGNLTDCINDTFIHMDSLAAIGKSAFEEWKKCVLDKQLPEFTATNISGETIGTGMLKEKVVVINFWSINCLPCIAELPGLNKLVRDYKGKDVVFLAITWESVERIRKDFLKKYRFDFMIVPEALRVINKIAASGYPTTYIIDKTGIIKAAWSGGSTGKNAGEEYYGKARPVIDRLLK
jgi:peroxiredoxin